MLSSDIVSCLATRVRGRGLSNRRWATRGLGDRAVLGIGRIAHERPLAHGICSQLLRVLYLAELNGIDSHAVYLNSFSCCKAPFGMGRTRERGFTGGVGGALP